MEFRSYDPLTFPPLSSNIFFTFLQVGKVFRREGQISGGFFLLICKMMNI
jgi:hypothetical protein